MQHITLGGLTIGKVFETETSIPISALFPALTPQDLRELKNWYWDEHLSLDITAAQCGLSMHSYVLRIAGKTILIDSCNGNHKDRDLPYAHKLNTRWLERLNNAGVRPEDVDFVICTHLHFDHIGWNTRLDAGKWVPTFPRARYIFGRRDMDYFSQPALENIHFTAYRDSLLPVIEAGLAEIVEEDAIILGNIGSGLWFRPAFGHSPGCTTIHAQHEGPKALFCGDVFHHPVQFVRPDAKFLYDFDGEAAVASRVDLIGQVVDSDTVLLPAHFLFGSAGRVKHNGGRLTFNFLSGVP